MPANVLIDADGQVKLTDFGLVKFLQVSSTMMGNSWGAGTVLYMAPEQSDVARQREIGPAADIYALGVISYEMLAGRVPFEGDNEFAIMDAHRRLPPTDPRQFNPQLPADVVPVLMKVLDKQPANRYPTATAFVEALAQAIQGQPIGITTGSLGRGISSDTTSGITTSSLRRGGGSSHLLDLCPDAPL